MILVDSSQATATDGWARSGPIFATHVTNHVIGIVLLGAGGANPYTSIRHGTTSHIFFDAMCTIVVVQELSQVPGGNSVRTVHLKEMDGGHGKCQRAGTKTGAMRICKTAKPKR